MWVFTQDGFVSVVDNGHVENRLCVRARDRASLEPLADLYDLTIIESANDADYEWRLYATRDELANWLVLNVETLDYPNFKNRVKETRGDKFAKACAAVWQDMLDVSDKWSSWSDRWVKKTDGGH
jgi:hypothetical protein